MTPDEVRQRVAPWVAPLSGDSPAGQDARYHPDHEEVRAEVAKLESPGADPVDWAKVSRTGTGLLQRETKDLVIAAYTAYALFEQEGLAGLAAGLELVHGLAEGFWAEMFPAQKRARARGNALGWLVERAAYRLENLPASETDAATLSLIAEQTERLAQLAQERLEGHAPAIGPLRDALQRARASLPEGAPAATAGAAPAAAPRTAEPAQPQPATPQPVAADSAPAVAAPPAETAPPVPDAAADAAPGTVADAVDGPDAELHARKAPWLQPIRDDAPTGDDLRYDEVHEAIRAAVRKLDAPTGEPPDWPQLLRDGEALLKERSKDLLIASHVAYALYDQRGLDGLVTGLALVEGLLSEHWDGLYPHARRNLKARSSAVAWLLGRFDQLSETVSPGPDDRETIALLQAAAERLAETISERFDDHRPAVGTLLEQVRRLALAIPEEPQEVDEAPAAPSVPAPPPASSKPAAQAVPAQPAQPTAQVSVPGEVAAAPGVANVAEMRRFLGRVCDQLLDLASGLRKANSADPLAYRLLRVALYLDLTELPPNQDGAIAVPAPPDLLVGEVEGRIQSQDWQGAAVVGDGSLAKAPLLLDLHRHVALSLQNLGPSHAAARDVVISELAALLTRLPGLLELRFATGRPLADDDTRRWIESEVLAGGAGGGVSSGQPSGEGEALEGLDEAAALATSGRSAEALEAFDALLASVRGGRQRFRVRLAMAQALRGSEDRIALGLYAALADELQQGGLEEWDPALASECLGGYHQLLAKLGANDKEMAQTAAVIYGRLCRVDPRKALTAKR
ncbi:MAG: type VI secretion system protein TssA [Myxococcales bacterium]|jgi:type VI secretion system protein VasJ